MLVNKTDDGPWTSWGVHGKEVPFWFLTKEEQAIWWGVHTPREPLSFYSDRTGCGTYQQWQVEVARGEGRHGGFRQCLCWVMQRVYSSWWHTQGKFLVVYKIMFPLLPPPEPYIYIGETEQILHKRLNGHRNSGTLKGLFGPQSAIPGGMTVEILRIVLRSGDPATDKKRVRNAEKQEMSKIPYSDLINPLVPGVRSPRKRGL